MALPDTWRLLKQGRRSGEPTFPIFYQVQAALGKSCLFLPPRELASNSLFTPLQDEREQAAALQDWTRVCVAMEVLGIDQDEEESFWLIMAAITDLGVIAQKMEDTSCYDCEPAVVDKISGILGVTVDMFHKVVRRPDTPRVTTPVTSAAQSTASSRAMHGCTIWSSSSSTSSSAESTAKTRFSRLRARSSRAAYLSPPHS